MTRLRMVALTAACGLAFGVLVALFTAAGSDPSDGYRVRAIFDNASFVITGEDVKVAGVIVGSIEAVELTADNKAAVVLNIDDPAFRPFRADAHCEVGLQSLIGEQFIECLPTRQRADGERQPAELARIEEGEGEGQHLLPVENTTTPVGVDLLNDIMRLPQQQRFRLIIAELGAGLAANGDSLRAALRRASPALAQTNRVIEVLARQDRLLARLVDRSDRVLAPWAKSRKAFGTFLDRAGRTAVATAERGDDLEESFARFPAFLRELGPAADRFGALADEMTPALGALQAQAPSINASVTQLDDFTAASTPALETLGEMAVRGRRAFPEINAFARQLRDLAGPLRSASGNIAAVASSFDSAGGIESVMRFIYFYTGAVNGEDASGHYIRSALNAGQCVDRAADAALTAGSGCEATFDKTGETYKTIAPRAAPAGPEEQVLDFLLGDDGAGR